MRMAVSVEGSSPSLGDNVEYDEDDNDLSYASMSLRLFNDQFLENTGFRYLTFDEWQTGKVIQDAYAIVERPQWLQEFYASTARCAAGHTKPTFDVSITHVHFRSTVCTAEARQSIPL